MDELEAEIHEEDEEDEEDEEGEGKDRASSGAAAGAKGEEEGGDEDEDDDDILDFVAGPLSGSERQLLVCSKQLMEVATRAIRTLTKALLEGVCMCGCHRTDVCVRAYSWVMNGLSLNSLL